MMSHPNLTLSSIEQTGPRGYIRPLFFFQLGPDAVKEDVFRLLRESLKKTKDAVPMLSAELVPDTKSEQKGKFLMQQGDFGVLHEKDLRGNYDYTFEQLQQKAFPSSAVPQDVFCPFPVLFMPGKPIPVFEAQANFIEGGLILTVCIAHLAADARAVYEILKCWSQNFRHLQDPSRVTANDHYSTDISSSPTKGDTADHPESSVSNTTPLAEWLKTAYESLLSSKALIPESLGRESENSTHVQKSSTTAAIDHLSTDVFTKEPFIQASKPIEGGTASNHPEYVLTDTPPPPPAGLLKTTYRTEVFYFSKEKLQSLKVDFSATLKDGAWISTHDAVCALVWRCVLGAQVDLKTIADGQQSLNTICVDGRLRSSPPLPETHIGCPMVYATPAIDIKKALATEDLADVALRIRRAVESIDASYINSLVAWFNTIHSYDCLGPKSFGALMDTSVMTTSWFRVPFYTINWGTTLGGTCKSVRTVYEGFFNGSQAIMPELPEERGGGMEVIVGLDEANWDQFRKDKLWYQYAEAR